MANPAKYQTLSELRQRVLLRLGFVAQNAGNQYNLINDFLHSAQESLIMDYEDMLLQDIFLNDVFVVGESLYDITDSADPEQVNQVVYRDAPKDTWITLKRGIPLHYRDDERGDPYYYEIRWGTSNSAQIEFHPTPNAAKEFGYSFKRNALKFTEDGDRTTIDSELVFLGALMLAQRHFGYSEDSLVTEGILNKRLYKLRAKSNHGYEIKRGIGKVEPENQPQELRINIVQN